MDMKDAILDADLLKEQQELLALLLEEEGFHASQAHAITPREKKGEFPFSFAQQRLWFLDQLEPGNPVYNIPIAVRLTGPLNMEALEWSLDKILRRHEALRTTFATVGGQPVQSIAPDPSVKVSIVDLRHLPEMERKAEGLRLSTEEARQPFDLARGPLLRVILLRMGETEHILLLTMHHIISDGWSIGIFTRELSALYEAFLSGQPSPLPDLPIQYADFAHWQRQWLQGDVLETQLTYWEQQLAGAPPVLDLPTDRPRPAVQTFRGSTEYFQLSSDLRQRLETLSQQAGATLFMTLLAAFVTLLARYSGQEDIVVGFPIANRNCKEIEPLIGFFVNTLVLRTNLSGNPPFRELLGRVREVALGAYDHQDIPFERLVEALQPERNLSHAPLFQVMFALQNVPTVTLELPGLTIRPMEVETGTAKFDLSLFLEQDEEGMIGRLGYSTDLFEAATIARMARHFETLLEGIVADPTRRLSELPLLTGAERHQLLVEWNNTRMDYPQDQCIHQLFEAQVERTPEAMAVVYEEEKLTYEELNQRANQLAHYLQAIGVGPEVVVGICLERSLEMVVGVLGILKARGAYVPLDPDYPQERLAFMLQDTQAPVLLTQQRLAKQLPEHGARVVCLDTDWMSISHESEENPVGNTTPETLAYVIYTSGSTGRPKGVVIRHRSVLNLLTGLYQAIYAQQHKAQLRISLNGPLAFDTSVKQLIQLLNGHTLYILPWEIRFNGDALLTYLQHHELDVFDCTPSQLDLLLAAGLLQKPGHKPGQVLVAGEAIDESTWQTLAQAAKTTFWNLYGSTECTVDATASQMWSTASKPTIGRPLANTQVYILDHHLQPVPISLPGELYIGGAGLARGYLNRPELTAENFIPNPFGDEPGARLYKTGDLARYLPDGNIEFLGRFDHQVKIRGFRIELGEIEAVLGQHPAVREAVVLVRENVPAQKRLVAYVVPNQEQTLIISDLRSFLQAKSPDYMLPSAFVQLKEMPLTPNGKVDRRALPAPDVTRPEMAEAFVAPRTQVEALLANIWAKVLGIEQVGIHDNFFELGGDSILSIQIVARANQAGLQLTPRQLFQHQTVAELAAVAVMTLTIEAEQGPVTGPVPLTPIQHRFFEQHLPDPHHWNQTMLLEARQPLDPALLERVVQYLMGHHDALRLRFERKESGWQQVNAGPSEAAPFIRRDLSALSVAEQGPAIESAAAELQASLNLSDGPLVRVALLDLGLQDPNRLLIVIHHLAVDGVSWRILLEDLQTAYQQLSRGNAIQLPPKTTSFKQWSERLTEYARSPALQQELDYWLAQDRTQVPRLLVDYPEGRSANTRASARTVSVSLSAEETRALLQEVPAAYRTQINDALLTALVQAFARWTGSRSLLIDLEGHGREEILEEGVDLSRTVGWFTTVFPVLLHLEKISQSGEALPSIKKQLRHIPNRGIGYGLLRYLSEDTEIARKLCSLPQAEVSFNYLGQFDQTLSASSMFRLARESSGPAHSRRGSRAYLLEINGSITEGRLQLDWTYSENTHRRATIEGLAQGFVEALRSLIAHSKSLSVGTFGYISSDFPLAKLDQPTLERLSREYPHLEDVYPLSPGQQEMLRYALGAPNSGIYFLQWQCVIHGNMNTHAFKQAWQHLVDRHQALRTAFIWEGLDEPLQVVHRRVQLPREQQDWRGLPLGEQQQRLRAFLQTDQEQGFELSKAPLMRLALIRVAETTYQFIWSHHHLLLDGWSIAPIWKEVLAFYEAYCQNRDLYLEQPCPYRDYIAWLQQQDWARAKVFWRKMFKGVTAPTPLMVEARDRDPVVISHPYLPQEYTEQRVRLSSTMTAGLQSLAQQHRLTLNTLVLGAWALLLSCYSGQEDVVFGVTVSGRPADLTGIESIVGLFINTLPMRVEVSPEHSLLSWLRKLQDQQVELRQYEYISLTQVQEWSGVPLGLPLFESFLRFQNYPPPATFELEACLWESDSFGSLEIQGVHGVDWWQYPLGVVAVPGLELSLRIAYNQRRFEAAIVTRMLRHFQTLLEGFVVNPEQCLGALMRLIEEGEEEK